MTKMYMKKDCQFVNNRIIHGDEIVAIDPVVFRLLDTLEEALQAADYILDQPAPQAAPSLDGFTRSTVKQRPLVKLVSTPFTDMEIMRAMHLMKEYDTAESINAVNKLLDDLAPVIDFVNSDYIIECPNGVVDAFDLVAIGNPLELTEGDLIDFVLKVKNSDLHIEGEEFLKFPPKIDLVNKDPEVTQDIQAFEDYCCGCSSDTDSDDASLDTKETEEE